MIISIVIPVYMFKIVHGISDVGIGTGDESDVFPERQVGFNTSGSVKIAGDGIHMGNDIGKPGNLADALDKSSSRKKRSTSQLHMEPGRYVHCAALQMHRNILCQKCMSLIFVCCKFSWWLKDMLNLLWCKIDGFKLSQ